MRFFWNRPPEIRFRRCGENFDRDLRTFRSPGLTFLAVGFSVTGTEIGGLGDDGLPGTSKAAIFLFLRVPWCTWRLFFRVFNHKDTETRDRFFQKPSSSVFLAPLCFPFTNTEKEFVVLKQQGRLTSGSHTQNLCICGQSQKHGLARFPVGILPMSAVSRPKTPFSPIVVFFALHGHTRIALHRVLLPKGSECGFPGPYYTWAMISG